MDTIGHVSEVHLAENVLSVGLCPSEQSNVCKRSAKLCTTHVLEVLGVDDSLSFPLQGRYGMMLSDSDVRCESM